MTSGGYAPPWFWLSPSKPETMTTEDELVTLTSDWEPDSLVATNGTGPTGISMEPEEFPAGGKVVTSTVAAKGASPEVGSALTLCRNDGLAIDRVSIDRTSRAIRDTCFPFKIFHFSISLGYLCHGALPRRSAHLREGPKIGRY